MPKILYYEILEDGVYINTSMLCKRDREAWVKNVLEPQWRRLEIIE